MSIVALKRCEDYDLDLVTNKINAIFDLLGGIDKYIKKDAKVFIKCNCVGPFAPDMGITTHPVFVEAVIKVIKNKTDNIILGDNPATRDILFTLKKTKIFPLLEKYNIKMLDQSQIVTIHNDNAKVYSSFEVSKEIIDCDILINLAKLKTHTLTYMTGCHKNYFGLIYGLNKAGWHVKANNPVDFAIAFNDLYGALLQSFKNKVILNFTDGILGLELDGPSTGGRPKMANAILASTDAVSCDVVACQLVNLDANKLILAKEAEERKIGDFSNIEIVGDNLSSFDVHFDPPTNNIGGKGLALLRKPIFRNALLEHPKVDHSKCIRCGECAKICPPHTMKIKPKEFPRLKASKCIRCWCCAEVCPQNAIYKSNRPLIGKIVFSIKKNK